MTQTTFDIKREDRVQLGPVLFVLSMESVKLPLEVLDMVLEHLGPNDLLSCRSVDRHWNFAVADFFRRKAQLKRSQRSRLNFKENYAIIRNFNKNILRNTCFWLKYIFVAGDETEKCSALKVKSECCKSAIFYIKLEPMLF